MRAIDPVAFVPVLAPVVSPPTFEKGGAPKLRVPLPLWGWGTICARLIPSRLFLFSRRLLVPHPWKGWGTIRR